MQINNNPLSQFLNNLTSSTNTNKSKYIQTNKTNSDFKETSTHYNVRNMTPTEFQGMINDLRESGQITEKESMKFTLDRLSIEMLEGKDTHFDYINFYENQFQIAKSNPEMKGLEQLERSLQILQGIHAKNNTKIPSSI